MGFRLTRWRSSSAAKTLTRRPVAPLRPAGRGWAEGRVIGISSLLAWIRGFREHALPGPGLEPEQGVGDQEMPEHRLPSLHQRRHQVGGAAVEDDAAVAGRRRRPLPAADDADGLGAYLLRVLAGRDDVQRQAAVAGAAADREDEEGVPRGDAGGLEGVDGAALPAVRVDPGRGPGG